MTNKKHIRRGLAGLLAVVMLFSLVPAAFAAQENGYHDPAEHWLTANNRTNELDANAVVTRETGTCHECGKPTSFEIFRTPEYTRDGQSALLRGVKYSDGTMNDGESKGSVNDGTPGVDAYYTGFHWTKAVCENCGTVNSNMGAGDYGYGCNVYWLYDCAAEFMEDLDESVSYEYADDTHHTKTVTGGSYCCFCYGTHRTEKSSLERHDLQREIVPELAHQRFVVKDTCTRCGYEKKSYTAAKSVVADYYGEVDGKPHTLTVTDLSEAGVMTQIRYGSSAEDCTLASAPNYTEAGQYTVYYEITYTYKDTSMTENGVAYVWLHEESTGKTCPCGCGDPDCGCTNQGCGGDCCKDDPCGENHRFVLLDSVNASCLTLGYDRYLCTECGKIEKRDYTNALGHSWQGVVVRDATCEESGKLFEICSRCGEVKATDTPKGEHSYKTYSVAATCTAPGYTVRECAVCGDRHITDITSVLPHDYKSAVTPASCETGGSTLHLCAGCGSSFVTDYTDALGHSWDKGTTVTDATCGGEGVTEYHCSRCGYHRLEGDAAKGHTPGDPATCTAPQTCLTCGAVLKNALGHDYKGEVTAPTCEKMGYTTFTCSRCDDSYKGDYADATGHKLGDWITDKDPTTDSESDSDRFSLQAYLPQEDGKAKIGDVLYIGTAEKCRELMVQLAAGELTQGEVKELFAKAQEAEQGEDTFSIYQLKRGDETRDFRFEPYDRLQAAGLAVKAANYDLIYTAPLAPGTSLEDIFTRFNIDHPADFKGHSLSVSDVVVLHQAGQDAAHYVDSIGYREVPEFLREQPELTPEARMTGEQIRTPRGSFHVTDMTREQMEAAGFGFHHQSEDGKYFIMGDGTQAFAVAAEPPQNHLKHIEDTVEQNDNNFDGIINNTPPTPTVDELEARVQAGEQISLLDLADAIKADTERGKEAKPEKKPSIRAQLKADKERAAQRKTAAKAKSQDLERS